jgi:hypothetical protein
MDEGRPRGKKKKVEPRELKEEEEDRRVLLACRYIFLSLSLYLYMCSSIISMGRPARARRWNATFFCVNNMPPFSFFFLYFYSRIL